LRHALELFESGRIAVYTEISMGDPIRINGRQMSTRTISVSGRGFERCRSICEKDFAFIGNNFEYQCTTFEACFLSPRVCQLLREDRSVNSFIVEYEGENGGTLFGILEKLMDGQSVDLRIELERGLLELSRILGNSEIVELMIEGLGSIETTNICRRLEFREETEVCVDSEIEFAASHFYEIDEEFLRQLPVSILESILSCGTLRLRDEDSLLNFINTLDCDRHLLYRYLKSEYLSCEGIALLVESLNADSLDCMIWSSLCRRLVLQVCKLSSESLEISKMRFVTSEPVFAGQKFPFVEGSPFNGIISFLTTKCGGNVHTKDFVTISSSSEGNNHCWQVADHGWANYWHSQNRPNSWISFNFKTRRVSLSHYTLMSYAGIGTRCINWVIEGSNDFTSWTELDRRSTRDLVGSSIVKTYPCSNTCSTEFQYLRMRQTGVTSSGANYLVLTNIESFGQLHETQ
jgi:hypothetical protein